MLLKSQLLLESKAQLISSPSSEKEVDVHQWTAFLQQFFKTIPNILKYRKFYFSAAKPGVLVVQEYSDTAKLAVDLLRVDYQVLTVGMPKPIPIKELDLHRQWYLYEQIL